MIRSTKFALLASALALAAPSAPILARPAVAVSASTHADLVTLFTDWRRFVQPQVKDGLPDYSAAAMAKQAAALPAYKARLAAIDTKGWSPADVNDHRLVTAEMNGLDFFQRVLKPWARDPSFYATIFQDMSDVPAHEGPSAQPNIDLFAYTWPLSRADDAKLASQIGAIPALLEQARTNLAPSQAHDLWAYGDRAFREQSDALAALDAGHLVMNDLGGKRTADMKGASPKLHAAIRAAKAATDAFADWVKAEAPKRTGPSGVGKDNYNWYLQHVTLNPYSWDDQVLLLQRELDRSLASLRLEETRNRALPPIAEIGDPAKFRAMALAKTAKFNDFVVATGLASDKPYFREAMIGQTQDYTPPADRNFFLHVTALDPLPLLSHASHWIELARLKHEPHPSAIRDTPPLFNIYADRSEGFATAFEEIVMQAGLYDDIPHGRELVWIMLANRAARGLASLRVQANEIDLAQAGQFHARWTPRHFSDPASKLVGFEQLLYLRQPGYGPSYIVGKLQLDHLLARAGHEDDVANRPFALKQAWSRIIAAGIVPPALIEAETFPPAD
ncbi:DUF885 family protein [Sphingomonas immobilis]|uniref:DUF885 family protein n=1 Tax=Sphingomonas immobilis TaxID=3063997 RepID=A0ABT8ZZB6_9SPHN|nr:DUF885 family protein [Sphingomonas sp. CA1-15]MDO7842925.1 DUF885 family protein [Sphingomonas sp. CA1-15]